MTRDTDNAAFVQHVQRRLGLTVDGWAGAKTRAAFDAAVTTPAAPLAVVPARGFKDAFDSPARADLTKVFGKAGGADCTAGRVVLPFPFVIAWDQEQRISRFSCHVLVAPAFTSIFQAAAAHYGEARFRALRLDLFGGCFNYRPMRGGTALSTHAWGIACDLDPARNPLRASSPEAAFSHEDYQPFWQIVEAHGAVSLGRARNYDWMHFQFCKL